MSSNTHIHSDLGVLESLIDDHRIILRALNILERILGRIEEGAEPPLDAIGELLEFFRAFVDQCHHRKEEEVLFPRLGRRGIPAEGGPIGVMLTEHDMGRSYIKDMFDALRTLKSGNISAKRRFVESARSYIDLLRQHIYKEDNVLFPMGSGVLTQQDHVELHEAFEKIEKELGAHERYIKLVEKLEKELI